MATAVIVCHECGKELSAESKFCSQCGAKIASASPSSLVRPSASELTCAACGHVNTHDGAYCEACGAKLPGRTSQNASSSAPAPHSKPQPKKSETRVQSRIKLEAWHYAVGVLILALVGVFIYVEAQRTHTRGVAQQQALPMQFPSGQNPATPPSQDVLSAIQRLEQTVKENPNDAGSKLLLANALHDAGTHDAAYLPRAIEAYRSFLKAKPNDPNARVDLGICYFEVGKLDSTRAGEFFANAVKEMEAALKSDPKHQPGAFNLGIVQLYSGNFQESNKWFKKAVDLNPESDLGKRAKTILDQHSQQM